MRIGYRSLTAVLAVAALPLTLVAQHAMEAQHEVGVDIAFTYQHLNSLGLLPKLNHFLIGTPVDVRIGFIAGDRVVVEPRLNFQFDSKDYGGQSLYRFSPDVNLLWAFQGNKRGAYGSVGVGIDLLHASGQSASQFSVNGGVGTRVPYESGAIRLEAFGRYTFKNEGKGLPGAFDVGARIGLSLWH